MDFLSDLERLWLSVEGDIIYNDQTNNSVTFDFTEMQQGKTIVQDLTVFKQRHVISRLDFASDADPIEWINYRVDFGNTTVERKRRFVDPTNADQVVPLELPAEVGASVTIEVVKVDDKNPIILHAVIPSEHPLSDTLHFLVR